MKRLLILVLTLFLIGATPAKVPPLLPDAAIVSEGYAFCPGDVITIREYNLFGSKEFAEARTFSIERDGQLVVVVYMRFPDVDKQAKATQIIVIPEGESPREMTFDELVATYPSPCSLIKPRA